jgi:hypothetical protein|tara:strand:- start:2673 stop:2933 length:261 start_codon:yes stop_codon:yes gene_type:complete
MLVEILLGILIIAFSVEGYVVWNLMKKTELLEDYVGNVGEKIINVNERLAEIDSTGHFEADDEVGTIFDTIKETVSELNEFISEEK